MDIHVTDTDAKFYVKQALEKVLESQEKEKKRRYLEPWVSRTDVISPLLFAHWMACLLVAK